MKTVGARVIEVAAYSTGVGESKMSLESTIGELGLDEYDVILFAIELEEEFGVEIDRDKMYSWSETPSTKLADIAEEVKSLCNDTVGKGDRHQ